MSLLSIIQDTAGRLGIGRPGAVIGASDTLAAQLLSILIEECEELLSKNEWQALIQPGSFVTTSGPLFSAPLPVDYDRLTYGSDLWNRSKTQTLLGPCSAPEWQELLARNVSQYPQRYRFISGALAVWGASAGETITYEYVSNYHVRSSTGTVQPTFQADTDTSVLPDRLLKLGLRWRFKQAKGLDYGEDMATYERELERMAGVDGGYRIIVTSASMRGSPWAPGQWPGIIRAPT